MRGVLVRRGVRSRGRWRWRRRRRRKNLVRKCLEVVKDKVQLCFNPINASFQALDPSALSSVVGLKLIAERGHQRVRQLEQKLIF